ncbi:XRE family transcriptional regulator [Salipiger sp. PrR003]|uniref:XRE family transcriptional regulator n=1 Tax=Salipiger sp. PrR003 TaxID=2706776 RepID=UPI0013DC4B36|nr:XRE family transcriptional regulator [Salipiger sp. PrR003]NDV48687.1 XRE family transcriptional regulator [Salipiger sp. PrR003]
MTTEIGKELRKLRIDEDERLLDMSQRLNKSSAFISAVERGTKSPPSGFEELVIKAYWLAGDAADALRRAADRSRKAFTIEADTPLARDTAGLMARRMDSLSDDELKSIFQILNKKDAK